MYTDSHCHLNFPELVSNLPQVLQAMRAAKVVRALSISTTMEEFSEVLAIANVYHHIWASVGVHPDSENCHEPSETELIEACRHPKVVAIGETGLDYYKMDERKEGRTIADLQWQRERFRVHIRAAQKAKVPLIIHTRAASDDTLRILQEEGEHACATRVGGVFHCFTESVEIARKALDLGYYISLSGIVTFKNAHNVHEVARLVPEDRLLIETDSPYLTPVPYRGKPNSPAYVPYVAARIAELRGVSVEHIAVLTSTNFDRLFQKAVQV